MPDDDGTAVREISTGAREMEQRKPGQEPGHCRARRPWGGRAAQKALALVGAVGVSVWIIEHSLKTGQNLRVIFNGGFRFWRSSRGLVGVGDSYPESLLRPLG